MWKDVLNMLIEFLLFMGTLITIACLVVFMFISSKMWMTVLAGLGAINSLYIYDRYRRKNNKIP